MNKKLIGSYELCEYPQSLMIANDLIPCADKYKIAAELMKLYQIESDTIVSTEVSKQHCLLIDRMAVHGSVPCEATMD